MSHIKQSLKRAIEKAGPTQAKFAKRLQEHTGQPCTQQAVSQWLQAGRVPADWILPIEELTDIPARNFLPVKRSAA